MTCVGPQRLDDEQNTQPRSSATNLDKLRFFSYSTQHATKHQQVRLEISGA